MDILQSEHVYAALVDKGIIDDRDNVRRIVIDLKADNIAVMHVEYMCDEQLLDVVRGLDGIEVRANTQVAGKAVHCPIQDEAVVVRHDDGTITFDEAPAWTHVSVELLVAMGSYERSVFDAKYELRDACPYDATGSSWHVRLQEHR